MAILIVPDVVRMTVNQSGLRPAANVLHFYVQGGGEGSRDEAVDAAARALLGWWEVNVRPQMSESWSCESVSYLDLDSAQGATGVVTNFQALEWPASGDVTGESAAVNTAYLVKHDTVGGRGTRNGRTYVGGLTESQKDGSLLTVNHLTTLTTIWGAYVDDLTQSIPDTTGWTMQPCTAIVLTRDAEGHPLTGVGNGIQASSVERLLATQRRRMRG